jgi:hypothetical protein
MNMKSLNSTGTILISLSITMLLMIGFGGMALSESQASDVAIKGYDSVAYFKAGKALQGSESFSSQWHNMAWLFLTKENKALFVANPEKYAPQYDGYCAWAMSEAVISPSDPEIWKIVDGKLYLLCSQSAYEKWSKDIPGNIEKADEIWKILNTRNDHPSGPVRSISFEPTNP